jgi:hypothetical protein
MKFKKAGESEWKKDYARTRIGRLLKMENSYTIPVINRN